MPNRKFVTPKIFNDLISMDIRWIVEISPKFIPPKILSPKFMAAKLMVNNVITWPLRTSVWFFKEFISRNFQCQINSCGKSLRFQLHNSFCKVLGIRVFVQLNRKSAIKWSNGNGRKRKRCLLRLICDLYPKLARRSQVEGSMFLVWKIVV